MRNVTSKKSFFQTTLVQAFGKASFYRNENAERISRNADSIFSKGVLISTNRRLIFACLCNACSPMLLGRSAWVISFGTW